MTVATKLATSARSELPRVNQFIAWLRYGKDASSLICVLPLLISRTEGSKISSADPPPIPALHHDILQVNEYLTRGLENSELDEFFTGPVVTMTSEHKSQSLGNVLAQTRMIIKTPEILLGTYTVRLSLIRSFAADVESAHFT
jgi:hypothetical protein